MMEVNVLGNTENYRDVFASITASGYYDTEDFDKRVHYQTVYSDQFSYEEILCDLAVEVQRKFNMLGFDGCCDIRKVELIYRGW